MSIAVYGLSADPPTNGHLRLISYGAAHHETLYVVLANNPQKRYTFSANDRLEMLIEMTRDFRNVKVAELKPTMLLVRFAASVNASILLRGIRTARDQEYESGMSHFNEWLAPTIRTVYVPAAPGQPYLSSSLVKSLVGMDEWRTYVPALVPPCVMKRLEKMI